eukprot:g6937.t1
MREEQVANGVNFLVHPKVKTAPLSQRISFLENKGLTPEEIQVALSRVEAGQGDLSATAGGGGGDPATSSAPFSAEASVPLWRQVAVPGALVVGAVGALGTYYAASRSSERGGPNHQSGELSHANGTTAAAGRIPYSSGGAGAEPRGMLAEGEDAASAAAHAEGAYSQERLAHSQRLLPFDGGSVADAGPGPGPGEEASSLLSGEFRRLAETMEQQTGHLVEAVGAMKALASRAEQDSSSLLAARVSSHTSELRAELGTIKQLLLLQARVEGGVAAPAAGGGAAIAAASGTGNGGGERAKTMAMASPEIGADGAEYKRGRSGEGIGGGGDEGVKGATENQANGLGGANNRLPSAKDLEREKAEEAADKLAAEEGVLAATARRKDVARAALAALLADNAPQAAKDGIAMLRMLVANLVNQPNVPRYRRIATSNDNFKKRLLPLEGHRAMMEAVGFKPKGSLWEWTWHEDSGPSASSNNKAVLEDVVKAIDALVRPNGPPLSSAAPAVLATAAPTPASTSLTPPALASTAAGSKQPAVAGSDGGTAVSEANDVMARQQPRFLDMAAVGAGGGNVSGARSDAGTGFPRQPSGGATATKAVLAAAAEVNGAAGDGKDSNACEIARLSGGVPAATTAGGSIVEASTREAAMVSAKAKAAKAASPRGNSCGFDAVAVGPGAPPASMAEVAAAIQRGHEPPGIRVVEDRLSADAQSLVTPSQLSPPKPWEVFAGASATGATAAAETKKQGGVGERAGEGAGGNGRRGGVKGADGRNIESDVAAADGAKKGTQTWRDRAVRLPVIELTSHPAGAARRAGPVREDRDVSVPAMDGRTSVTEDALRKRK